MDCEEIFLLIIQIQTVPVTIYMHSTTVPVSLIFLNKLKNINIRFLAFSQLIHYFAPP